MTYEDIRVSTLDQLAKDCHQDAKAKGFWEDEDLMCRVLDKYSHEDKYGTIDISKGELSKRVISLFNSEKIALEMSELAERLECLRKDPAKLDEHCPEFLNVEIEVADLIIRAMDFAGRRGLRIGEAIVAKMEYNSTRPYKHNKNF